MAGQPLPGHIGQLAYQVFGQAAGRFEFQAVHVLFGAQVDQAGLGAKAAPDAIGDGLHHLGDRTAWIQFAADVQQELEVAGASLFLLVAL